MSSGSRTVEQCTFAVTAGHRALSRITRQPEFSQFAGAIGRDREPNLGRARQFQQRGAKLQCGGAQFPNKSGGWHAWLSVETVFHRANGRRTAAAGAIQFWHTGSCRACSDRVAVKSVMQAILPANLRGQTKLSAPLSRRRLRSEAILLALSILFAVSVHAAEVIPPKPDRYINDYAGVVSRETAGRFNEQLAQFERETADQVVVAVFPKVQSDSDIADYTQRVAQAWGVGQKERRNGVVLFVFVQDRKMFIQVGYGLEGALPDITAFDITEYRIKPHFCTGDYEGGVATGIDSIFKAIRGEYKGSGKTVAEEHRGGGASNIWFFIIFMIVLIIIFRVMRRLGGYGYSFSRGGPVFLPTGGGGGW